MVVAVIVLGVLAFVQGVLAFAFAIRFYASVRATESLVDRLSQRALFSDAHEKKSRYWEAEAHEAQEQRDEYLAENERLKKAAAKLVMHVAETFGREVTNPRTPI